MNIDRSIFSRDQERRSDLHLQLSEKYMIYKDYAERAMINPQNIGKSTFFLLCSESKKYYITAIFITFFLTLRAYLSITTVKGDNRVFYMRPDTIFLEPPRCQNAFRNDFLKQVSTPPQPEPFIILADSIQKSMTEDVSDQSLPQDIRHMMVKFYKRRQYKL